MPQEVLTQSHRVKLSRDVISALRQRLVDRIGQQRFELWFGPQIQWLVADDAIVVTAPNSFVLDCLRRQFATEIRHVVETICGESTRAEFRIDSIAPANSATPNPADIPATVPLHAAVGRELDLVNEGSATDRASPVHSAAGGSSGGTSPGNSSRNIPRNSSPGNTSNGARRYADLASFVAGGGNRVAYTAAKSVVQRPGTVSPLYLYGPPGTGKSHLLEGVCTAVRANGRGRRVLLLSAEQFTCHFLEALQGSGLPNFRRKCREVDLLVIDDIQFLASGKKTATLLEFQHTMDALARQGKQLLVASDRAPTELAAFGAELITRLTGGLVCGITSADYETRLGITQQFVDRDGYPVRPDVVRLIAAETCGDARQIRGALNRLRATSQAFQQTITLEMARESLYDLFASAHRMVRLPDVERAVCEVFGMESKSLREGGKTKSLSQPRMLAMWLARKYTRAAFSEIGQYFGRRSHSTVISAERKVNRWVAAGEKLQLGPTSWNVDEAIRRIETKLRTG